MDGQLHLSKLKCEPVARQPRYGPPSGHIYWRVYIDEEILTDSAQPFTAADPTIELFGNEEVPIWGDGRGYVSVRQIGPFVIWCKPLEQSLEYFLLNKPGLTDEQFIVFDVSDYMQAIKSIPLPQAPFGINNAKHIREFSGDLKYSPLSNPENSLPQLSSAELSWLITPFLPADDLPLYMLPENSTDRRGVKLLKRVKAAIKSNEGDISAIQTPISWTELHIGLDVPEFQECVWRISNCSEGCAILFVSNPHFPIWLLSPSISHALEAECLPNES